MADPPAPPVIAVSSAPAPDRRPSLRHTPFGSEHVLPPIHSAALSSASSAQSLLSQRSLGLGRSLQEIHRSMSLLSSAARLPASPASTQSVNALGDLLTDDAFVECLNAFLALPAFPRRTIFVKRLGIICDAASLVEAQLHIREQRPGDAMVVAAGFDWFERERLPYFLVSDYFILFILGQLLHVARPDCEVLRHRHGIAEFAHFLRRTSGERDFLYWVEAERYRLCSCRKQRKIILDVICERFLADGAALELSGPARDRAAQVAATASVPEMLRAVQEIAIENLVGYWLPRFLSDRDKIDEEDEDDADRQRQLEAQQRQQARNVATVRQARMADGGARGIFIELERGGFTASAQSFMPEGRRHSTASTISLARQHLGRSGSKQRQRPPSSLAGLVNTAHFDHHSQQLLSFPRPPPSARRSSGRTRSSASPIKMSRASPRKSSRRSSSRASAVTRAVKRTVTFLSQLPRVDADDATTLIPQLSSDSTAGAPFYQFLQRKCLEEDDVTAASNALALGLGYESLEDYSEAMGLIPDPQRVAANCMLFWSELERYYDRPLDDPDGLIRMSRNMYCRYLAGGAVSSIAYPAFYGHGGLDRLMEAHPAARFDAACAHALRILSAQRADFVTRDESEWAQRSCAVKLLRPRASFSLMPRTSMTQLPEVEDPAHADSAEAKKKRGRKKGRRSRRPSAATEHDGSVAGTAGPSPVPEHARPRSTASVRGGDVSVSPAKPDAEGTADPTEEGSAAAVEGGDSVTADRPEGDIASAPADSTDNSAAAAPVVVVVDGPVGDDEATHAAAGAPAKKKKRPRKPCALHGLKTRDKSLRADDRDVKRQRSRSAEHPKEASADTGMHSRSSRATFMDGGVDPSVEMSLTFGLDPAAATPGVRLAEEDEKSLASRSHGPSRDATASAMEEAVLRELGHLKHAAKRGSFAVSDTHAHGEGQSSHVSPPSEETIVEVESAANEGTRRDSELHVVETRQHGEHTVRRASRARKSLAKVEKGESAVADKPYGMYAHSTGDLMAEPEGHVVERQQHTEPTVRRASRARKSLATVEKGESAVADKPYGMYAHSTGALRAEPEVPGEDDVSVVEDEGRAEDETGGSDGAAADDGSRDSGDAAVVVAQRAVPVKRAGRVQRRSVSEVATAAHTDKPFGMYVRNDGELSAVDEASRAASHAASRTGSATRETGSYSGSDSDYSSCEEGCTCMDSSSCSSDEDGAEGGLAVPPPRVEATPSPAPPDAAAIESALEDIAQLLQPPSDPAVAAATGFGSAESLLFSRPRPKPAQPPVRRKSKEPAAPPPKAKPDHLKGVVVDKPPGTDMHRERVLRTLEHALPPKEKEPRIDPSLLPSARQFMVKHPSEIDLKRSMDGKGRGPKVGFKADNPRQRAKIRNMWRYAYRSVLGCRAALLSDKGESRFRTFVRTSGHVADPEFDFWQEVERYKFIKTCNYDVLVGLKIAAIFDCFLESVIPPAIQITVTEENLADIMARRYVRPKSLFSRAQSAIFDRLLQLWPSFARYDGDLARLRAEAAARREQKRLPYLKQRPKESRPRPRGAAPFARPTAVLSLGDLLLQLNRLPLSLRPVGPHVRTKEGVNINEIDPAALGDGKGKRRRKSQSRPSRPSIAEEERLLGASSMARLPPIDGSVGGGEVLKSRK